jgi:hypothetical protein
MFHVPRTVGLGCHTGSAVLFSPWRIAFRVDAIYACISSEARRLMFFWKVVRASGHSPSHSGIRLSLLQQHVPLWRFCIAAGDLYSAQHCLHACSCDRPISYQPQTQNLQKTASCMQCGGSSRGLHSRLDCDSGPLGRMPVTVARKGLKTQRPESTQTQDVVLTSRNMIKGIKCEK